MILSLVLAAGADDVGDEEAGEFPHARRRQWRLHRVLSPARQHRWRQSLGLHSSRSRRQLRQTVRHVSQATSEA